MFLFNQQLLPTRTRCHRLDPIKDATCPFCNEDPETDEHLMYQCPERLIVWSWLEGTISYASDGLQFVKGRFDTWPFWTNRKTPVFFHSSGCLPLHHLERKKSASRPTSRRIPNIATFSSTSLC
ncbi:hypothetical protein OUZ56_023871 [Daphnia magna]|uniref:Reverse transcriptase zinc-binding domain-containing protein n=1 Tax=Daphnia magna TaxID=35525 RepID=A0ABR0AZQ1_9CRUS|nr:hypothetical protein OUZ56_023864 [Daphnia magna]KAK4030608.1 hypothetical protein OUZ56_023871 [Daphnia magna]